MGSVFRKPLESLPITTDNRSTDSTPLETAPDEIKIDFEVNLVELINADILDSIRASQEESLHEVLKKKTLAESPLNLNEP
jgi:hypothetical protein